MAPLPHLLSPCPRAGARNLFSETGVWDRDYKADTRRRVEHWWHPPYHGAMAEGYAGGGRSFMSSLCSRTPLAVSTWAMYGSTPSVTP
uniref:Leucyl-tRNA synthetase 2, mitochondrial n=1 Tax=Hucho hucho TaxID=62062 RepID=A0A4W5RHH2_9TELE